MWSSAQLVVVFASLFQHVACGRNRPVYSIEHRHLHNPAGVVAPVNSREVIDVSTPFRNSIPRAVARALPETGKVHKYNFTIARQHLAPDGLNRSLILVNGKFPGPTIEGNLGDYFEVTVTNSIASPAEGMSRLQDSPSDPYLIHVPRYINPLAWAASTRNTTVRWGAVHCAVSNCTGHFVHISIPG
jgi:FtsP/CotA-like multicopper oxidase with cupredoxin domain